MNRREALSTLVAVPVALLAEPAEANADSGAGTAVWNGAAWTSVHYRAEVAGLPVLVFWEHVPGDIHHGAYIATFLDVDVLTQGPTVTDALDRLGRTLAAENCFRAHDLMRGQQTYPLPPAPEKFRRMWDATREVWSGAAWPKP